MTLRTLRVRSLSLYLVGSNDPYVPPGLVVMKNLAVSVANTGLPES